MPGDGGRLLVIGGAEQLNPGRETILQRFVSLAGGAEARIAVIATATTDPAAREAEYREVFLRLGAGEVEPVRLTTREEANADDAVARLATVSGVFFTGGDQRRITNILGGSRVDSLLHARLGRSDGGIVLAGTSAGAAMMSGTMIVGGSDSDARVATACVRTGPGLEFLPGVLIDMHFAERGRLNRLLSAIAMYPHELGLGIDEDTAIEVHGDRFEVLGSGAVTVIDAGRATHLDTPAEGEGPIALCGVQLHVLPAGYAFALTERRPQQSVRT